MRKSVKLLITTGKLVLIKKGKTQVDVVEQEINEDIHIEIERMFQKEYGRKRVDISLILMPPMINVNVNRSIENERKYKYLPKKIEDEARLLEGKGRETHYLQCATREYGDLLLLNIYTANIAGINIFMENLESTRIRVVEILPFFHFIGAEVCKQKDGVLMVYGYKDKEDKRTTYIMLYDKGFLVGCRGMQLEGDKLKEEVVRTIAYTQTNMPTYAVTEVIIVENSISVEKISSIYTTVPIKEVSFATLIEGKSRGGK